MLTVRIIYPSGSEHVTEALFVEKRSSEDVCSSVYIDVDGDAEMRVDIPNTRIYVMNETGKTIANYLL